MPTIKEYSPAARQLSPSTRGQQAWETAGRRVGPLYNQAAQDEKEAGRVLGDMERAKSWPFDIYALRESMAQQVRQTSNNETSTRSNAGGAALTGRGIDEHNPGGASGGVIRPSSYPGSSTEGDGGLSSADFSRWKDGHAEASAGAAGMSRVAKNLVGGITEENGVSVLRGGRGGRSDMESGVVVLRGGRGNVPGGMDSATEVKNDVKRQSFEDALRHPYDPSDDVATDVAREAMTPIPQLTSPHEDKIIQSFADKWNVKNPTEKMSIDKATQYLFPERFLPSAADEAAVDSKVDEASDASQRGWVGRQFDSIIGGIKDTFNAITGSAADEGSAGSDDEESDQ